MNDFESLNRKASDLWQAKDLLEAVIESIQDAVSVADENGVNIMVNSAYSRITGLPREAVLNKSVTVDIAEGESMHMKVLRSGRPVSNVRMKVGPMKREVVVNVAPILIGGVVRGSVGVVQDISAMISLTRELTQARKIIRQLKARYNCNDIIGRSPSMDHAKEQARRAAQTPATVLLRGESGIGKELFAHAIHNASERREGQFVRVNCAALTPSLLESELFGYEKGAFTGALKDGRKGLFEVAGGGTIFLDEIGELDLSLQSKILRALQEKEIVRVGGTSPVPLNVRVIAATNSDLEDMVADGRFREDLFYRLNVIPIHIPPLRQRKEDVVPLVDHLLFKLNDEYGSRVESVSPEAMEVLLSYHWPGNVRELENILGRAIINMGSRETVLEQGHLPPLSSTGARHEGEPESESQVPDLESALAAAENRAIMAALHKTGGNKTSAASLLQISLRSLYYKMKKHGIKYIAQYFACIVLQNMQYIA